MSVLLTFLLITIERWPRQIFMHINARVISMILTTEKRFNKTHFSESLFRKIVYDDAVLCVHFVYASMAEHLFYFTWKRSLIFTSAYLANVFWFVFHPNGDYVNSCFSFTVHTHSHMAFLSFDSKQFYFFTFRLTQFIQFMRTKV